MCVTLRYYYDWIKFFFLLEPTPKSPWPEKQNFAIRQIIMLPGTRKSKSSVRLYRHEIHSIPGNRFISWSHLNFYWLTLIMFFWGETIYKRNQSECYIGGWLDKPEKSEIMKKFWMLKTIDQNEKTKRFVLCTCFLATSFYFFLPVHTPYIANLFAAAVNMWNNRVIQTLFTKPNWNQRALLM